MGNFTPEQVVTDAMVERAWLAYDEAVETCAASDLPAKLRVAMRAALTAALAQNTQGDGEPVAHVREPEPGEITVELVDCVFGRIPAGQWDGLPLYTRHADRARVPEFDK